MPMLRLTKGLANRYAWREGPIPAPDYRVASRGGLLRPRGPVLLDPLYRVHKAPSRPVIGPMARPSKALIFKGMIRISPQLASRVRYEVAALAGIKEQTLRAPEAYYLPVRRFSESDQPEFVIRRLHALIDRKLLGELTQEESDELDKVRQQVREMDSRRAAPGVEAAERLRKDRQRLLKAVESVGETLKAIQRRIGKAS